MKGIVFNELEAMVRERLGEEAWGDIVDETTLETPGGIFAGPKVYPDADFLALFGTTVKKTQIPPDQLLVAFGRYLFPRLAARYPMFIQPGMTAKDFLKTVHSTIHVEVRKLHPEAILPSFGYEEPAPDRLVMTYASPRRICDLAVGLIEGVAERFGERIEQQHPRCTKRGDGICRFELTFRKADA